MASSSRRSASASCSTATTALLRWVTSMTDMPQFFQLVISDWACSRTSSGSVAGPAAKLNTRMIISSSRTLLPDRSLPPDVIARRTRTISGRWRVDRATRRGIPGQVHRRGPGARPLLGKALDALDSGQSFAFTQPNETHALGIASNHRYLGHGSADQRARGTDHHEFVIGTHLQRRDHLAITF